MGCWMSPSGRMTAACATARPPATSPFCARSPSTSSPETAVVEPAYAAGARRPPGTMPTCSRSSPTRLMREPWVGPDEVGTDIRVSLPPGIPLIDPLPQDFEVLLVRHLLGPACAPGQDHRAGGP